MKIYPSQHEIRETENLRLKDIPLSYLDSEATKEVFEIVKDYETLKTPEIKEVEPYEKFSSTFPFLFDSTRKKLSTADMLLRQGNDYLYMPRNAVEFSPTRFSFSILVKKNLEFKTNKPYNIRASVIDGNDKLSEKLITIFGDAPRRGISPNNISINNRDLNVESLSNSSFAENDFIFIETVDGRRHEIGGEDIDYDKILNSHSNIWLSTESFGDMIESEEGLNKFKLRASTIYSSKEYEIGEYERFFDETKDIPSFMGEGFEQIDIFEGKAPFAIFEKKKKGYVIVSHKNLFAEVSKNSKFIYEVMMQIFFKSYYKTEERNMWISDEPVDMLAFSSNRHNLAQERVIISSLLKNNNYEIGEEYSLVEVPVSSKDISFQGIGSNGVVLFAKAGSEKDPKKESSQISIYTQRGTIINYEKKSVNKIEDEIDIREIRSDIGNFVSVQPFISTSLEIYSPEVQTLRVPKIDVQYLLTCRSSLFKLVEEEKYKHEEDGLKIAKIKVISKVVPRNYDMRILGGGLPEGEEDDFNLLDIGHTAGRPHRLGGAMVIKLPKRLEPQKEIIKKALEKHCTSGDYPIIVFE